MLTGNKELLNKYGALKQQLKEIKREIDDRILENRVDNNGYKIKYSGEFRQYMIVDVDLESEV